jgi:hypothetical protein
MLLDARVIAAARVSVVLRPMPVVGVGYPVLPRLVGEAHGTVGVAGASAATLAIRGEAVGEVDDFPSDIELMLLLLAATTTEARLRIRGLVADCCGKGLQQRRAQSPPMRHIRAHG